MKSQNSFVFMVLSFGFCLSSESRSPFLDSVRRNTLVHHAETNTVWEYIGVYAQTENTLNFVLEIPVFQFMCDVFPTSMAFAMQACTEYRDRVLDHSSARQLNELVEAHTRARKKRQMVEVAVVGAAAYGAYKIIGDLFNGDNDEIIHRLDESDNFKKHQETLDDVLITTISSLEDSNLAILKEFKSLFDSVNVTRSLIHNLLQMSIRQQGAFTGWAKFSLKSEMRRHYERMVSAISRVENHDLNLEMFTPEQRTFVHEMVWNRIHSRLPRNFSASLAQFVPNLLVQQVISFSKVNESEISYELKEADFNLIVETDSDSTVVRNETIDLDSILPKIVGHARIENFFAIPSNVSRKRTNLYRITRLPLFVAERKAVYVANIPQYLSVDEDGSSSEWFDSNDRKCTVDDSSHYMFCSIPVPVFSSIQHPCLRSIVRNTSVDDCLKETVDLSSPNIVKLAPNIHAISVYNSLQCFEKGDKEKKNVFSNVSKVAVIKTRCNSFVSCGSFDFSSTGDICEHVETHIFSFKNADENLFKLDESVNPVDINMTNLNDMMDMSALVEAALSHKKHLENARIDFHSHIIDIVKTKGWPKILIGLIILLSMFTVFKIFFVGRIFFSTRLRKQDCSKRIRRFVGQCPAVLSYINEKTPGPVDAPMVTSTENCILILKEEIESPCVALYPCLPYSNITANPLGHAVGLEKPNPLPRKTYGQIRRFRNSIESHSSTTSGEFFEEDRDVEN
jgi:hypothetical protein